MKPSVGRGAARPQVVKALTLCAADERIGPYAGASENSYRSSVAKALAGFAVDQCCVRPHRQAAHVSSRSICLYGVAGRLEGSRESFAAYRQDSVHVVRSCVNHSRALDWLWYFAAKGNMARADASILHPACSGCRRCGCTGSGAARMAVVRVVVTTVDILCFSRRSASETPLLSRWRCHRSFVTALAVHRSSARFELLVNINVAGSSCMPAAPYDSSLLLPHLVSETHLNAL
jgi:hypothetical protein